MSGQHAALAASVALILLTPIGLSAQDGIDMPLPRSRPPDPETSSPVLPLPRPPESAIFGTESDVPDAIPEQDMPRVYQTACPGVLSGMVVATALPPLGEGLCNVRSPLSVTGIVVDGRQVPLSSPATIGCSLAGQLAEWVGQVDAYAQSALKSGVAQLHVGTSYQCRPRNDQEGAAMSEHGFADALDVTGFSLVDGSTLSLPGDWDGDGAEARAMRYAQDAACGLFTTVLGPDTNALHGDHLHLDLGCHGATCTYRICE